VGFQGVASLPNRKCGLYFAASRLLPATFQPPPDHIRPPRAVWVRGGRRLAWLQALADDPRQRARPAFPAATGADFSFASSDFKSLGAFFCNSCNLVIHAESRTVSRASAYYILWVRGFRDHTISGRGFNLFNLLRRHFRATPFLPSGPLAPRFRRPKRLCSKTDDRPADLRRDGAVRTNIERLRDSGKKFVERVVGLFELPSCAQFCRKVK
jgi:hypothetical protein